MKKKITLVSVLLVGAAFVALAADLSVTKSKLKDALKENQNWEDLSVWMTAKDKQACGQRDAEITKLRGAQTNSQVATKL